MPAGKKKIYWCRSSSCPDGFGFTPGTYCKAALTRDIFIDHQCGFVPKICTVDRDDPGLDDCVWVDYTSPHAKSLKKDDPKTWGGSWLKVPDVPRFQPVVSQYHNRQCSGPESTQTLQQQQEQCVLPRKARTGNASMRGHPEASLSRVQSAGRRKAEVAKSEAHLTAGAASVAAGSPDRLELDRKRKHKLCQDPKQSVDATTGQ